MVKRMLFTGMLLGMFTSCQPDADPILTAEQEEATITAADFGTLPAEVPAPADNPTTTAKAELGRLLFWDPILSGPRTVSCATCHHPAFGYSDGRELPIGTGGRGLGPQRRDVSNGEFGIVPRNSPTVINTAFNGITAGGVVPAENAPMFWDNRAQSLENQALGPPTSFEEMRGHAYEAEFAIEMVVARLYEIPEYVRRFRDAFGARGITDRTMAEAIAAFERTIVARNSPFDRYQAGDLNAMPPAAQRGMVAFAEAGCNTCHSGPMFSDYRPHVLGVPDHADLEAPDAGAGGTFGFRTPTLRNLSVTAPYMHNGTSRDLEEVMDFYLTAQAAAQGNNVPQGEINPNAPELDPLLASMQLRQDQVDDIIAFMEALDDPVFDRRIPNRVPSGLPVGGAIGPAPM
ncbi:MAG: cytochrome c peroxidase [Bacteroidota bacterium]